MKKLTILCTLLIALLLPEIGKSLVFAQVSLQIREAEQISYSLQETACDSYEAALAVQAETMPMVQYAISYKDNISSAYLAMNTYTASLSKGGIVLAGALDDQDEASKAYKSAYNHILDEEWDKAAQAMDAFIKANPKSRYADDAAFWKIYATEKTGAPLEDVFKRYQAFAEANRSSKWKNDAEQNMLRIGHQLVKSGKTEYEAVIRSLEKSNEEEVRLAALYALQNIGDDERALKTTMALYDRTQSDDLRSKIVYMLGNYESADVIPKLVEIAQKDESARIRKAAVHALGNTEHPQAIAALKTIVQSDMDKDVRSSALYSLGNTDDKTLVPFLRDLAIRDEEKGIASAAVYSLGNIEGSEALTALMDILEKSGNKRAREAALYAISNRDDSAPLPLLERIALEDTTTLRSTAVYAIGNMETEAACKALENIFTKSSDKRTRESALHAIANTETKSAITFLKTIALNEDDERLARSAVYALGSLTEDDKNQSDIMLDILGKSKHSKVKEAVLMQIVESKDTKSLNVVVNLLKNEKDATTRRMAVRVLGYSENNAAVSVLLSLARDDENVEVRKEAVRALGQIGTTEAQDAIMQLLGTEQ